MRSTFAFIVIFLIAAGGVLWYVFVFSQSTTAELKFGQQAVVIGTKLCKPQLEDNPNKPKCVDALRDEVGHYFVNKTGKEVKLFFTDNYRVEGILVKPDSEFLEDYYVDGYIVETIKE